MGDKQRAQYQCMNCGTLSWIEDPPNIDKDELYVKIGCSRCGKTANHLWVGSEPGDEYLYYDCTLDERFYTYKTK